MGWLSKFFGEGAKKEETMKMAPAAMKEPGKEVTKMAKDPVCGMEVEESKAAATSDYKGKKYYFCAVGCKKAFDENPQKYLKEEPEHPGHGR